MRYAIVKALQREFHPRVIHKYWVLLLQPVKLCCDVIRFANLRRRETDGVSDSIKQMLWRKLQQYNTGGSEVPSIRWSKHFHWPLGLLINECYEKQSALDRKIATPHSLITLNLHLMFANLKAWCLKSMKSNKWISVIGMIIFSLIVVLNNENLTTIFKQYY